jgi:hypothetical protein
MEKNIQKPMIYWFLLAWHVLRISLKIIIINKIKIYNLILYGKIIKLELERNIIIWLWWKLKIIEFVGMENLKWLDILYFNSVFAETYCIIIIIYWYGNFILYILSTFMMIDIAK